MGNEKPIPTLSDVQKDIFEAISKDNIIELKLLLGQLKVSVDYVDENGMSPLQHACYKGNKEAVQLLLDQGADVNSSRHDANYSALHFAALSGKVEICLMLLNAGAKPNPLNQVNRTPAQMAAFVGNHHIVASINNFVSKASLEYYTRLQGQQTEPYLPVCLLDGFHKFIINSNIHPVRIVLNMQKYCGGDENLKKFKKVLELMCEKEMQRRNDKNEIMSLKYHYLAWIISDFLKFKVSHQANKDQTSKPQTDYFELYAKRLLKGGRNGQLDYLDRVIRDCIREFPYRECVLFHQIVTQLTSKECDAALDILRSSINGQRGFMDVVLCCSSCGEEKPDKKCAKCRVVGYCDRECQRLHWFVHKKTCARESGTNPQASPSVQPEIDTNELSEEIKKLSTVNDTA